MKRFKPIVQPSIFDLGVQRSKTETNEESCIFQHDLLNPEISDLSGESLRIEKDGSQSFLKRNEVVLTDCTSPILRSAEDACSDLEDLFESNADALKLRDYGESFGTDRLFESNADALKVKDYGQSFVNDNSNLDEELFGFESDNDDIKLSLVGEDPVTPRIIPSITQRLRKSKDYKSSPKTSVSQDLDNRYDGLESAASIPVEIGRYPVTKAKASRQSLDLKRSYDEIIKGLDSAINSTPANVKYAAKLQSLIADDEPIILESKPIIVSKAITNQPKSRGATKLNHRNANQSKASNFRGAIEIFTTVSRCARFSRASIQSSRGYRFEFGQRK